ncbi:hypothetical protein [Streptomyces lasiicapitis]|uniref:hypothetical protein n=1 Tax=Streptomyces lasiicapitis TaxID=1923961 RepID=UPI0036CBF6B0
MTSAGEPDCIADLHVFGTCDEDLRCYIKIVAAADLHAAHAGDLDEVEPEWATDFTPSRPDLTAHDLGEEARQHVALVSRWRMIGELQPVRNSWHWTAPAVRLWTIDEVAEHLGVQKGSARGTLSRWGVRAAEHVQLPGGRVQAFYDRGEVRSAAEARPGRGTPTDLKK